MFLCPACNLAGTAEIHHWMGLPFSIVSSRQKTVKFLLLVWRICSLNVKEEGLLFTTTKLWLRYISAKIFLVTTTQVDTDKIKSTWLTARHWPVLTAAHCQPFTCCLTKNTIMTTQTEIIYKHYVIGWYLLEQYCCIQVVRMIHNHVFQRRKCLSPPLLQSPVCLPTMRKTDQFFSAHTHAFSKLCNRV